MDCKVCNEYIFTANIRQHPKSQKHQNNLKELSKFKPIEILSDKTNCYVCGMNDLYNMKQHITCVNHNKNIKDYERTNELFCEFIKSNI